MRYLNRQGSELPAAEWQRLARDLAYCQVREPAQVGASRVECSWVGVALDCERNPGLFFVGVKNGGARWVDELCTWWPDEESAAAEWWRMCRELEKVDARRKG